jgi:hypothetical protein
MLSPAFEHSNPLIKFSLVPVIQECALHALWSQQPDRGSLFIVGAFCQWMVTLNASRCYHFSTDKGN